MLKGTLPSCSLGDVSALYLTLVRGRSRVGVRAWGRRWYVGGGSTITACMGAGVGGE